MLTLRSRSVLPMDNILSIIDSVLSIYFGYWLANRLANAAVVGLTWPPGTCPLLP